MKTAKFLTACLVILSLSGLRAEESLCTDYVKFEYSVSNNVGDSGTSEIHLTNLDSDQKIVWHLIPVTNSFERKYLETDILRNVPPGEYEVIVRDQRVGGKCPVVKSIVINK